MHLLCARTVLQILTKLTLVPTQQGEHYHPYFTHEETK